MPLFTAGEVGLNDPVMSVVSTVPSVQLAASAVYVKRGLRRSTGRPPRTTRCRAASESTGSMIVLLSVAPIAV